MGKNHGKNDSAVIITVMCLNAVACLLGCSDVKPYHSASSSSS